jgi:putative hydrolase of the HAD superfamily
MEVKMKYKLLLFDADETLFDFKKAERYAIEESLKHFNIAYEESVHIPLYHKVNHDIWKEFEQGKITQDALKAERFRRFFDILDLDYDSVLFSKTYMKYLGQASFLYEKSKAIIDKLSKSHRLAIITNGLTEVQENRISKSSIAHYFEEIIISEAINLSKPNPEIFSYALNKMNHNDKKSVLMIGDSLTSDIKGGINFGIDTCWYNPNKISNTFEFSPTYEISDLYSICDII